MVCRLYSVAAEDLENVCVCHECLEDVCAWHECLEDVCVCQDSGTYVLLWWKPCDEFTVSMPCHGTCMHIHTRAQYCTLFSWYMPVSIHDFYMSTFVRDAYFFVIFMCQYFFMFFIWHYLYMIFVLIHDFLKFEKILVICQYLFVCLVSIITQIRAPSRIQAGHVPVI